MEKYLEEKSIKKVAKKLDCSKTTVRNRLKKYGKPVELRKKLGFKPNHKKRENRELPEHLKPAFKEFIVDIIEAKTERRRKR
ncbi:MAG: hypothetical protein ACOC4Y_01895 [bacterium]